MTVVELIAKLQEMVEKGQCFSRGEVTIKGALFSDYSIDSVEPTVLGGVILTSEWLKSELEDTLGEDL